MKLYLLHVAKVRKSYELRIMRGNGSPIQPLKKEKEKEKENKKGKTKSE